MLAAVGDRIATDDDVEEQSSAWWVAGLGTVLAIALILRVWSIDHGLPIVYNPDEAQHFVRYAVQFLETGSLDLDYFVNPPALTYLLAGVFAVVFGGPSGAVRVFENEPGSLYFVARLAVAILGVLAVWILYFVGKSFFNRRVGLLSSALAAVAFLPVHWAHLAVNDVPTMVPVSFSLLGTARVLRSGDLRWYAFAGAGLGLAVATKYTAGIILLPLLAAFVYDFGRDRRQSLKGIGIAAGVSVASFVLATPSALINPTGFLQGLDLLSLYPVGDLKVGQTAENGWAYYLWVATWGLGWIPMLFGILGSIHLVARRRILAWVLLPSPLLYVLFMGNQDRFFGRWLLPIVPIVILIASHGVVVAWHFVVDRIPWRALAAAIVVVAVLGQSFVHDLHMSQVMARTDTRELTLEWMLDSVPDGSRIVNEILPIGSAVGLKDWRVFSLARVVRTHKRLAPDEPIPGDNIASYMTPSLIGMYRRRGICWVVTGSHRYDRALAEPAETPGAVAYYRRLARQAEVAYQVSPYLSGRGPVPFNFDWASNFYPFDYHLPGGEMIVYHLNDCD